jgi:hypothetical protein
MQGRSRGEEPVHGRQLFHRLEVADRPEVYFLVSYTNFNIFAPVFAPHPTFIQQLYHSEIWPWSYPPSSSSSSSQPLSTSVGHRLWSYLTPSLRRSSSPTYHAEKFSYFPWSHSHSQHSLIISTFSTTGTTRMPRSFRTSHAHHSESFQYFRHVNLTSSHSNTSSYIFFIKLSSVFRSLDGTCPRRGGNVTVTFP